MSLKVKILASFLLLSLMMLISGIFSIYELSFVNDKVEDILKDNYQSLQYANRMLESIEKENSAVLLLMHDQWQKANLILKQSDSSFLLALAGAQQNITEKKEGTTVADIKIQYAAFKKIWQQPISETSKANNLVWYYSSVYNRYIDLKHHIKMMIKINQKTMFSEAQYIKERRRRAILPGIIAIISSIIFSFLFSFFISTYTINPLKRIISKIQFFHKNENIFDADIKTNDELKELEQAIQNLINELR